MRRCGNHSTFSANRDRLLNEAVARLFFRKVLALAEWQGLVSDEHFSVDGTLIEGKRAAESPVNSVGWRLQSVERIEVTGWVDQTGGV